jgi:hypothetical protein
MIGCVLYHAVLCAVLCCAAEDFTCMTDFLETAAQAVADVDNCKVRPGHGAGSTQV